MQIDVVFSGGGVKAFAYIGVLAEMEKKGLSIKRAAGTSAGAIIASFLIAGYTAKEIETLLDELDLTCFLDSPKLMHFIPFSKWGILFFKKGIYKGNNFEYWLETCLARKGIRFFGDLPDGALKVVASDLTLGRLVVFPDDLEKVYGLDPNSFPIAKAVRMSAGFPFFFMPATLISNTGLKSQLVDGGMLSNFPLWLLGKRKVMKKRPVLGIRLSVPSSSLKKKKIDNAYEMCEAMISTMKTAHDSRYISTSGHPDIMEVAVKKASTMDLNICEETKKDLIQSGRNAATSFFAGWPN
ncbi:patatin-like phospholipase family protein [Aciduricibacillus chroicocephali]|uniref:Patatin-like phospholipase family protein n=1 Tax=Aciduricibacillus chroicocephali TaxID=3054939 RepID=A0ABY9KRM7_9BACI|nr:patatin-like phospholipase family protein [Bacillaceae bacterium 44XB]